MLQDIVSIGDKIDIRQIEKPNRHSNYSVVLVSQVYDFIENDAISIAMPILNGRLIGLLAGEQYQLCFYTNKGLYQCKSVMVSSYRENNAVAAIMKIVSDVEKFQRRQYYRLECLHETEYRLITREEELLEERMQNNRFNNPNDKADTRKRLNQLDNEWNIASVTNLSGGGCRFTSNLFHNTGDKIRFRLDIIISDTLKKLIFNAVIISSDRLENRPGKYEYRAEFRDVLKKDREELIKYIFEQERRKRKKENP